VGFWIGMDEAGIGPNFGPLVVAAVVWETPDDPRELDFWVRFRSIVSRDPKCTADRLIVADSKLVFQPAKGVGQLERTALAAWSWGENLPTSLGELLNGTPNRVTLSQSADAPWHRERRVSLPHDCDGDDVTRLSKRWRDRAESKDVHLRAIFTRVVHPPEFNQLLDRFDNKADAVATVHQSVARAAYAVAAGQPTLMVCDKHGGRNRYAGFLSELLDGEWVTAVEEGADASVYRCGHAEFRFEPRGERYGPVAMASMIAKYLRELHMLQFNAFWKELLPEVRPTQGYPDDARRFLADIEPLLPRLNISSTVLWRSR